MFNITKNTFLKNGCVWYKDDFENTLFIKAKQDGASFTCKIRLNIPNFTIAPVTLNYPFTDIKGINFSVNYNANTDIDVTPILQDAMTDINVTPILQDAMLNITQWVGICNGLMALKEENLNKAAKLSLSIQQKINENTKDVSLESIKNILASDILSELINYPEMADFIKLFLKEVKD